ncbi:FUSC family protein [Clostridium sp. AL.422]|uniref:FUSC family protein n=1 Tax=Clostridium TaxID=1485 RepID=UPI00293DE35E|nr:MULTISPECIES: FUSC family protein [unclassified Clostridium]MDV4152055.1 FUSC family protein [Clostridium sp. AL.422]
MKNKIISNTLIFIFIVGFVNIFKIVFGEGNTLMGVTIITMALVLMEKDLTISPVKNFIKILSVNMFSLLASVLAVKNIFLGIGLNFIVLFVIGYLFSYDLKKSLVVPFGLQYFFMLFFPAHGYVLYNRVLSLIFGTFFIMAIQLIVNRDKVFKSGIKIVNSISDTMLIKIRAIQNNESFEKENIRIIESINYLKRIIFDKRVDDYYLSNDGIIFTDILWSLERINLLLDEINILDNKGAYYELLEDVYDEVIVIKNRDFNSSNIQILKNHVYNEKVEKTYIDEFIGLINNLIREVKEINKLTQKERDNIKVNYEIPNHFHNIKVRKRNFNIDSAKVRYAVRLGIVGTFTVFIAKLLNLSEGRWMCFTIFSLIQPYSEFSKSRAKDRIIATIIGGIIVILAFTILRNNAARAIIILMAGYLDPFTRNYREKMIAVTVSAVASASLEGGTIDMVLTRIIFVIIGAALTLLANKYILPYKIKDMKKYLYDTYEALIKQMKEDIDEKHNDYSIRNLYLITGFIEDKMKLSVDSSNNDEINKYLAEKRFIVNSIYRDFLIYENL